MKETPSNIIESLSPEALSYSIKGFTQATSISETTLYADIKGGRLKTHLLGDGKRKKHIILREDGLAYLRSFPSV